MSKEKEAGARSPALVELHRAESIMSQQRVEIATDEKDDTPHLSRSTETVLYVGSKASSCFAFVRDLKVEVIMFMYMFSYVMRAVSSTTMIMDKVCLVHLGYSQDICSHLKDNPDIKTQVERMANNYSLGHQLVQLLPSSIISCFIGAWSDRYGRKLPIIAALVGIILDGLGSSLCAAFFYSRVEFYFIPALFTGLSGGFISCLTVLYSYAADVTTFDKRTIKYAIMEMAFGFAIPAGQVVGGWIFKAYSYTPVFLASTAGHVFALVWVVLVLKETKGLENTDGWAVKVRELFSLQPVVESFRATNKPRPNKGRAQIYALMVAMSFAVLSLASTAGISFLYVHHLYDWDNAKYSTISAVYAVFGLVAMTVAVPLFKFLHLGDATLGIVGSISMVAKNIGIGIATKKEVYFIANFAGLLSGLATLAGRSRISKVASKDDIGKIFSFLTTAESLLPIACAAIVSQVFNLTLTIYPGLIYLVIGSLLVVPLVIFVWLATLPTVNYEEIYNSTEEVRTDNKDKVKDQEVLKY